MSDPVDVLLVYVEFHPGLPPFTWLHERLRADDAVADQAKGYRILAAIVDSRGRTARRDGLRATHATAHNALLVEFALDGADPEGRRLRATTVFIGELDHDGWVAECAPQVVDILRAGGFAVDQGHVCQALEWGRASTAHRFPGLARAVRRLLRRLGVGRPETAFEPAGRA